MKWTAKPTTQHHPMMILKNKKIALRIVLVVVAPTMMFDLEIILMNGIVIIVVRGWISMAKYIVRTETEMIIEADCEDDARAIYWINILNEPQQTMGTYFEENTEVEKYNGK